MGLKRPKNSSSWTKPFGHLKINDEDLLRGLTIGPDKRLHFYGQAVGAELKLNKCVNAAIIAGGLGALISAGAAIWMIKFPNKQDLSITPSIVVKVPELKQPDTNIEIIIPEKSDQKRIRLKCAPMLALGAQFPTYTCAQDLITDQVEKAQ